MDISLKNKARDGLALYRPAVGGEADVGLACTGFGLQHTGMWVRERSLASYAAVFVDQGEGWLETSAAGRCRVEAPTLFWLHPGIEHSYGPQEGTRWHERWVLFEGALAERMTGAGLLPTRRPVANIGDGFEIERLFATLHSDFLDPHRFSAVAASATLLGLIARVAQITAEDRAIPARRLDDAVATLRAQAYGAVDMVALAHSFEMSPATFRRQVQAAYGLSPKAMQMQWRCARAKELLATTSLDIETVARQVGFEDAYYFSRVFSGREGMSPSVFRRRNRRS